MSVPCPRNVGRQNTQVLPLPCYAGKSLRHGRLLQPLSGLASQPGHGHLPASPADASSAIHTMAQRLLRRPAASAQTCRCEQCEAPVVWALWPMGQSPQVRGCQHSSHSFSSTAIFKSWLSSACACLEMSADVCTSAPACLGRWEWMTGTCPGSRTSSCTPPGRCSRKGQRPCAERSSGKAAYLTPTTTLIYLTTPHTPSRLSPHPL